MPTVQFFFDPACPWTWMTSRWLTEVAPARDLDVRWRSFSLKLKNEGVEIPEQYAAAGRASHRALRVIEAVRAREGDEPVAALYTELGRRIHHDGDNPLTDAAGAVAACRLSPRHADAADDDSWDDEIRASMAEALAAAGDEVGSPVLVYSSQPPVGFFGPIMSPPATGDAALRLWDGLAAVATVPGFSELKRSRGGGPQLGPRP